MGVLKLFNYWDTPLKHWEPLNTPINPIKRCQAKIRPQNQTKNANFEAVKNNEVVYNVKYFQFGNCFN